MGYRDSNTNYRADIKSVRFCFVGCSRRVGAVIGRPEIMRDIGKTQRAVKEKWADIKSAHRLFIYSAIISQSLFVNSTGFSIGIPSMSSAWEYRISAYSPTLSLLSSA